MDNELLKFQTNPQPIPSIFNEGFSYYETVSKLMQDINDLITKNNYNLNYYLDDIKNKRMLDENGNFTGTWEGYKPSQTNEATSSILDSHEDSINSMTSNINTINSTLTDIQNNITSVDSKINKNIKVENIGYNPIKSINVMGKLSSSNKLNCISNGGMIINERTLRRIYVVDFNGNIIRNFPSNSPTEYVQSISVNPSNGYIYTGETDKGVYSYDLSGGYSLLFTFPYDISAICFTGESFGNGNSIFIASDTTKTIYNVNIDTGAINYSFAYPSDLVWIPSMAYDGYNLFLLSGDSVMSSKIWRVDQKDGHVIETITTPTMCNSGIAYNRQTGHLFIGDRLKQAIFDYPMGGSALKYNQKVIDKIGVSALFNKEDNSLFDSAQEPSVIYENGKFKMWFSTGDSPEYIAYAESDDGITFGTRQIVIGNGVGGELNDAMRAYVFKNGLTYHCFYISTTAGVIHATSTDGITWGSNTNVITKYQLTSNGWNINSYALGNVGIYNDGSKWVMLLEAQNNVNNVWQIGRCTSNDLNTWTIEAQFPIINPWQGVSSIGGASPFKIVNRHYMLCHESLEGALPSIPIMMFSDDGLHWAKANSNPLMDWSDSFEVDQMADPHWVEVNGKTYLYYAANSNVDGAIRYSIKVAVADKTIGEILEFMNI